MTHWDLSDTEFLNQFEACSLASDLFSHEAHLRLAWLQLERNSIKRAETLVADQLKAYTKHLRAIDKYNHTVTLAAIKAVLHFKLKSKTKNFRDFIGENSQLKTKFKELLATHYSTDIFNSSEAKLNYLEPDLTPF